MKILTPLFQFITIIISCLLLSSGIYAQGWIQTYEDYYPNFNLGFDYAQVFKDIEKTPDGGYLALGTNAPELSNYVDIYLHKVDIDGNTQWTKQHPESLEDSIFTSFKSFYITATTDGNIMGVGSFYNDDNNSENTRVVKFDIAGNVLWFNDLPTGSETFTINNSIATPDNGIITSASVSTTIHQITKLDSNGDIIWQYDYSIPETSTVQDIALSAQGEIAITGYYRENNLKFTYLKLLDNNGNELWQNTYDENDELVDDYSYSTVDFHTSGDIILHQRHISQTGTIAPDGHSRMKRLTLDNTLVWTLEGLTLSYDFYAFCVLENGKIGTLGKENAGFSCKIFNEDGSLFSTGGMLPNTYPIDPYTLYPNLPFVSDGNSIILAGFLWQNPFIGSPTPFIVKLDEDGRIFTSEISGYIYKDDNGDCALDNSDIGLEGIIVQLNPEDRYAITDSSGYYAFEVNEGAYTITSQFFENSFYNLWEETCPDNELDIAIANNEIVNNQNLGLKPLIDCPVLQVDVGLTILRRCFQTIVCINYENIGTDEANNAYIEIALDSAIIVDSASVNYTIEDDLYIFDLGDIDFLESGEIKLYVTPECNEELGSTACIEANIYPNDFCGEINNLWDGSNIEVDASCQGDSIEFTLKNIGADMDEIRYYVIYEDDLLQEIINFQLDMDEMLTFTKEATGTTYRLEAEQSLYYPGLSQPKVIVEMCGDATTEFSLGYVTTTTPDDLDPFRDIECKEIIGSYDPNDKLVLPSGLGDQHYIKSNELLEYTIRFQNTGNDTAFNIFVIDTLSDYLDLNTFESLVSSHNYTVAFTGERVVRWDFPNVLLPDSTTNEVGSNGFIKFSIRVAPDVPQETAIHNIADIYFDFNEPIQTPDMFVTVCDECLIQHHTRNLNAKILLEGAYDENGNMHTDINDIIPAVQPYRNAPYNYLGEEELAVIPSGMVDWVLVEARKGTPNISGERNTITVESRAALLMEDGSIRDVDGISPVAFEYLINGQDYYFCIRHRNHLDVLTANELELNDEMNYDFTTNINQAFGPSQMKLSEDNKALLYAGDYNGDGIIQISDYDVWKANPAILDTYENADGTLDGVIQLTDFDAWRPNKAKIGTVEIGF